MSASPSRVSSPPLPFPIVQFSHCRPVPLTHVYAYMTIDRLGLKVAIADINTKGLEVLAKELVGKHGEANVLAVLTDVSKLEEVVRLRERVYEAWGEVSVVRRGCPLRLVSRKEGGITPRRGAFPCPPPLILLLGCCAAQ